MGGSIGKLIAKPESTGETLNRSKGRYGAKIVRIESIVRRIPAISVRCFGPDIPFRPLDDFINSGTTARAAKIAANIKLGLTPNVKAIIGFGTMQYPIIPERHEGIGL